MIDELLAIADRDAGRALRRNLLGLVVEAVLMGAGFALLVPVLRALIERDLSTTGAWLAALAGLLLVYALVRYRTQLAGYMAGIGLARGLFTRLGDHIADLPLGWFSADRVGKLGRLTSQGVVDVMGVPAHLLRPIVTAFVTPLTVVALMFLFDWRLALATLVTAPVAFLVYRWTGNLVQRSDHRTDAAAGEAAGRVVEFAQSQAVLRAFGRGIEGYGQLDAALQEQRDAAHAQMVLVIPGLVSFVLVVQFGFAVVLLFGTSLALGGSIDVPELLALLVLAARYVEPLIATADLGGALRISRNSLARMNQLFAVEPLPEPEAPRQPESAEIEFDDVHFSYGDRPLLTGVSFKVPVRKVTAVVGPSGSGKTTLVRLAARFWDPESGVLRIGGVDLREVSTADLMAKLSLVFQDVYLFEGTIEENIRMGRPDADDEALREAARLARVDEIVERLPDGYATEVGEGGWALSGGERQRVSIARAILKDAAVVLLDEATAALDPENEAAVQDALAALTAERTLLVIAHRLQTVQSADQIVFLDGGRVVEQGSHHELLAAEGRYAAFWRERDRAAGWRITRQERGDDASPSAGP